MLSYFRFRKSNLLFLLGFVISTQIFALKWLDYSTSSISWFSAAEEAKNIQTPINEFQTGNLVWDVKMYSEASELEPFRRYFSAHCEGLKGLAAASCLSKNLIKIVPFNQPLTEIFDENYSPARRLEDSLNGKPGHCVTYSSMTVDALLSVGIPARFAQVYLTEVGGHNVVEVWDEERGWVFFDPLNNGVLMNGQGRYVSVLEAVNTSDKLKHVYVDTNKLAHGHLAGIYIYGDHKLFRDFVLYPEPWIYTRVGNKINQFYRASFAAVGNKAVEIGPLQDFLRIGIVFCAFIWIIIFLVSTRSLVKTRVNLRRMKVYEARLTGG